MKPTAREAWARHRPTKDHPVDAACVAPWVSLEFDPSGWVYSCCAGTLYPLGRIGDERLRDLWSGPRVEVLREALQAWDLTVACGSCRWHLEHDRMDPPASVYDSYQMISPDPPNPVVMVFALSNRCNLGCIMCTPELSSTLRAEAGLAPLTVRYDEQFFADLEPMLEGLRLAKFLGGEPFLAAENQRIWEMLEQLALPPRLQVTTNGSIWTPRVERLLDRFNVDISVSIDAAGPDLYRAVRRGGDLATVHANVARFEEYARRKGTDLHVSYCLMDRNWQELADFLIWSEGFTSPSSINLVTDTGLALHDLDLPSLEVVQRRWEEDDRRIGHRLVLNRDVWETQLAQLEAVIAERRAAIQPAPRQAEGAPPDLLDISRTPGTDPVGERRVAEMRRLERWSEGGPVGAIELVNGRVVQVRSSHPGIGFDLELAGAGGSGHPAASLVGRMERAQGLPAWLLDVEETPGRTVFTLAMSRRRPVRGVGGSIVRMVVLNGPDGTWILAAEDRIYRRLGTGEQPIEFRRRSRQEVPSEL